MSCRWHRWAYLRETLLALAVITLTFLNFGHASVTAAADIFVTPDSWCGSPLAPEGAAHAPCHACRADGAALPPPPVAASPVCFSAIHLVYAAPAIVSRETPALRLAQPRGPPALV